MRVTQALLMRQASYRKLKLTTKDINKGYYKGTRTGSMGRHTKYGGYVIDYSKVRTYVVPPLENFKLTPFVTRNVKEGYGTYSGDEAGPRSAKEYLMRWKTENGLD